MRVLRDLFYWLAFCRLSAEMRSVLLGEVGPLLRQVVLRKDSRHRAHRHARATVDALDRVDEQLIGFGVTGFILLGVNAIDGTGVHAGAVFGADTGFCNYVCHLCSLRGFPRPRARDPH
jgi:hypothetical protein